jgi:predicted aspartyl protease
MLSHLIVTRVRINGSEQEYNFVVDTGAVTLIDKGLAQELGLKQKGMMAKMDTLDLSGFHIHKVFGFTTFDFNLFDALGTPIHGIIGSNLMERYRVTIDFEASSISFSSDTTDLECPEGSLLLPFRSHPVNSAPIVYFRMSGDSLEGMIDTGQPYPVVFPLEDFEEYESLYVHDSIRSSGLMEEWPMTSADHNHLARLKSLEFTGMTIDSLVCLFGELPRPLSMPLIGNDFLSRFRTVIDYPNHEILMIPHGDIRFETNFFSAGLNPDISADREVIVKGVWEGSPADRAGIEVGDRILSFDYRDLTPDGLIDLIVLLEDDAAESVTLEMSREDTVREVTLVKAALFGDARR